MAWLEGPSLKTNLNETRHHRLQLGFCYLLYGSNMLKIYARTFCYCVTDFPLASEPVSEAELSGAELN